MKILITGITVAALAMPGSINAQETNPTEAPAQAVPATQQGTYDNTPLYRVEVVGREIPAINYFQHKGTTEIGFEGTGLLAKVHGEAQVQSLPGRTQIHAKLEDLTPANTLGPEYLTYVLWAISPEGRPVNLGELLPNNNNKVETTVTTNMQDFGLMVTAEPYFAVTMPSNLVVAQNQVLKGKTNGEIQAVNVHYSLLPRGAYQQTAGRHEVLHPIKTDERNPLELYEAENAVNIAQAGGADQYAHDTMQAAEQALQNAEGYNHQKRDRKQAITYARKAVQTAEDARIITIRKLKAADEEAQRQAKARAEEAAAQAAQQAQQEKEARSQAEQNAQQAQEQAAAAQQQQQQAQEKAAAAQQEQQKAEQAAEQARQQQQQAEQQAAAARQQQQEAMQQTSAARQAAQQAEQNAQELAKQARDARERLRQQLSQVLQTRETASGLIMSMPDVLFGFNKHDLKPDAKVKLAKIAGILLAYPDLKVQVNGYTDNIGSADYNQKLSEQRANTVRSFLNAQNVPAANVTSQGYGENNPIATNSTNTGRAQNRRVELVVSGAAIGIKNGQQTGMSGAPETQTPGGSPPAATPSDTEEPTAAPPPQ